MSSVTCTNTSRPVRSLAFCLIISNRSSWSVTPMPPWSKTLGRTKSPTFNGAMVWNAGSCSRVGRASHRQNRQNPRGGLVGSSPRLLQGFRGTSGPDGARSGMPVGAEPPVEVEAHRGPPPVRGPERLRANPAQLFEALERALHDPGLRQPGPLLAVHLARGERAR